MSTEERKAIIRRAVEETMNKGNMAICDEILAPDYILHTADGMQLNSPAGFKMFISMVRSAFPDIHSKVGEIACDGDIVALRMSFTGTNTGEFRGMAPTGKKVTMQEALFYRFQGGKVVEEWQFINQLALFQQLGITPPTARPGG